jgi:hypothetical protein
MKCQIERRKIMDLRLVPAALAVGAFGAAALHRLFHQEPEFRYPRVIYWPPSEEAHVGVKEEIRKSIPNRRATQRLKEIAIMVYADRRNPDRWPQQQEECERLCEARGLPVLWI